MPIILSISSTVEYGDMNFCLQDHAREPVFSKQGIYTGSPPPLAKTQ